MNPKTPVKIIQEKINKEWIPYMKKLEKEKDEIKRLQITYKISKITLKILVKEIGKLSESQWEKYAEEVFEPIIRQSESISDSYDTLMMKTSKDAKEYTKYQKLKKISIKGMNALFEPLDDTDLSKKHLRRLLVLLLRASIITDLKLAQNNLDFYEFNQAGIIVQRRFSFDYNWLVCLALIQLHENLIKKKIDLLDGEIKEDEPIKSLIEKLSNLIKQKEGREVSLALLLSNGIKSARDTMSHEGYKHSVSKSDLEKVLKEVLELEETLYPATKQQK